jgi:GAF domain-containing protein
LHAISAVLAGSQGRLAQRLDSVARAITDAIEADRCWICRIEGNVIRTLAGVAMVLADPDHTPLPISKGLVGKCAREGVTICVGDVMQEPDYFAATALTRAEVCAPVKRDGRVVGVINVEANRIGAFGPGEQHVVEAVAELIAPHL